jgi:hypothetical protein
VERPIDSNSLEKGQRMKMYDLKVPTQGKNDKTFYNPVGVMFVSDDGKINLRLNLLPEVPILAFKHEVRKNPINTQSDEVPF